LIAYTVSTSYASPSRLSQDSIYAALSTIDLTGLNQNISASSIRSTPMKQQSSSSIFHVSASPNKSPEIPVNNQPTSGKK
jgi:hypothetical protein